MDKLNEGQLFTDKLNRLRGYRRRRSAWLSSQATETLDVTIRQLVWSADYFNALPKSPHGQQSTNPHT
jgi:hypothetical protein